MSSTTTDPVPADGLPPPERLRAMLSIAIGVGMASLDTAICNTALPAMAVQLHASAASSVWIVSAYQLAMIATLLPLAALSEIVGYRRTFLVGLMLFTAASVACASASSLPVLVAARLLQGLGGSAIMSVNGALLRTIYPAKQLGRGFGTNAMVVAIGFTIGPSLASLILSLGSWRWLFAINLPLGLVAVWLGMRAIPRVTLRAASFDLPAALCCMGALGLLMFSLDDIAHAANLWRVGGELIVALLLLGLLLRRESGRAAPMLPVDLLKLPLFSLSALTAVLTFATQGLAFVGLPFYFEMTLGRAPIETGFLMTPWAVAVGIMAPIAGRLSDRYPPGLLGGIGLAILTLGIVSLLWLPDQASALQITTRMVICGVGFGFFQAPNLKAIMSSAPSRRSGGASGIVATARLTGQATGTALVALCLTQFGSRGPISALVLAALFAAAGCAVSFSRLLVRPHVASAAK
jgi:DHA2 family multidrug resistance protein-like MFS transporter